MEDFEFVGDVYFNDEFINYIGYVLRFFQSVLIYDGDILVF